METKDERLRVRKEIRSSSSSDAKEARPIVLAVTVYARCDHSYATKINQGATPCNHFPAF